MLASGTLLQDRYTIRRHLASGGMGAVYVAVDVRFGNTVAIKQAFYVKGDMADAFRREARLLRHLRHPGLPGVIDFFNEGGSFYLVMDYIEGDDFSVLLRRRRDAGLGPFPYAAVVEWGDQILDVLDFLHTHEPPILHRDIKPQNLKLAHDGHVTLLDFGLSKGAAGDMSITGNDESVSGFTPSYAPPEQVERQGTTPQSDLFALGATLYHLMTGLKPPDASFRAAAMRTSGEDPLKRADELVPAIPPVVAGVLACALALDPGERPASALDMREALREALPDPEAGVRALEQLLEQIPRPEPPPVERRRAERQEWMEDVDGRDGTSDASGASGEDPRIAMLTEDRRRLELRMWIAVAIAVLALAVSVALFVRWRQYKPRLDAMPPPEAADSSAPAASTPAGTAPATDGGGPVDLGEGVTIPMAIVPAGSFVMGSSAGDSDERPPHRVTISRPFGISVYEVTQSQWMRVMASNPSPVPGPSLPVAGITWNEAQEFVARLNVLVPGARFRLATEAEWEYACRAGSTGASAGRLDDLAWHEGNSGGSVHDVGTREANPWGLRDMHGNVWEWCSDFYGAYGRGDAVDPAGPPTGQYRVIRGGAFDEPADGCRSHNRNLEPAGKRDGTIGLRLVRELP